MFPLSRNVLFICELYPKFIFREDVESLENISPTDIKCVWSTQKEITRDKYKPVPVDEMPCLKDKVKKTVMAVDKEGILDCFCQSLPNSAIAKHRQGRREECDDGGSTSLESSQSRQNDYNQAILNHACQSACMMYLASVKIQEQETCCLELFSNIFQEDDGQIAINFQQRSTEWTKQRKYRVTGSRCYELFTYSKNEWDTKAVQYFYPNLLNNKYVKHGLKWEHRARDVFQKSTGAHIIECGMVISHSNKWLGYSPDGIIFLEGNPAYLLEIKCSFEVSCLIFKKMSSAESITNFFPDVKGNLSRVTWAHAVNNLTYLTSTLNNSKIRMIEADVVLGTMAGSSSETIPIMAHPPANSSDLSLEKFLITVTDFDNNATAGTTNNTADSPSNGTTNSPDPNNSTNENGTSNGNGTIDSNAGTDTTGTNNTVAGGINSTYPNGTDNSSGVSDTNTTVTNPTGVNETIDSVINSTNPNDANLANSTDINNGTNVTANNSNGTNDTNTAAVDTSNFNGTTPDNTNNTGSANGSVPVNTARLVNTTDNVSNTANSSAKKGVKLDFKTIEAFTGSVGIISKYSNASFPIWLNADILPGPVNPTGVPVNATQFLSQAQTFKNAALSLGWTTTVPAGTGSYTDKQIDEMIDTIKKHNITNEITFAVRSALAAESLPQMKKLLLGIKDSTLTLWSAETDKVNVTKLRSLIANIGLDKIFIDVPDNLMKQLVLAHLPGKPSNAALMSRMSGIISVLVVLIVVFA